MAARGVGLEGPGGHLDHLRPGRPDVLHAAGRARGRPRVAASRVPDGGRQAHRRLVQRGARRPAVPVEDRPRPRVPYVLAVQAAHVFRRAGRLRPRPAGDRLSRRHGAVEAGMDAGGAPARLAVRVFDQQASPAFAFHQISDGAGDQEMASVVGTFVPTYQGLSAAHLVRPAVKGAMPYPFNAPHRLSYYRARNAIYHLFRALLESNPSLTVLAPDYYSGNEIMAIEAAGAKVRYCPIGPDMQWAPDDVERLCRTHRPDLLYVIHYAGWAQPVDALADLCRRREMLLVEDCALSLLSETPDGRALGSFGHWSVFCLYKTLPLPNGALLVQNATRFESLERLQLRRAGSASVLGRTAELLVQRVRGRANGVGAALQVIKRGMGRAAGALDVERANVGDIGFNLDEVDLAMSSVSERLLDRLDFAEIKRRRVENYRRLLEQLDENVTPVFPELRDGVCPLFFPILVADKHAAAVALQQRGVDALEFWNDGVEPCGSGMSADARFLREHVLELPIHQDLTPDHITYVARQVSSLNFGTRSAGSGARGSAYESPSASPVSGTVA